MTNRILDMSINGISQFKPYTRQTIRQVPEWQKLTADQKEAIDIVARVLPFRVNAHVLSNLINWDDVPDDPIYRLTFPQREMLTEIEYSQLRDLISTNGEQERINQLVHSIRLRMNPHPAGQLTHNIPRLDGVPLEGMQHKYRETVLFFRALGNLVMRIAPFASAGLSSSEWMNSSSTREKRPTSLNIYGVTVTLQMC